MKEDINLKELLMKDHKESVVGKKLLDYTTRRVIILVLAMLFSVPLFSVGSYLDDPNSYSYGLSLILELKPYTLAGQYAFNDTLELQKKLDTPLIKLYVNDTLPSNGSYSNLTEQDPDFDHISIERDRIILQWISPKLKLENMRDAEKEISLVMTDDDNDTYMAIYDLRG